MSVGRQGSLIESVSVFFYVSLPVLQELVSCA